MNKVKDSKLKISQLQALVAVADCGNFSLAALELGLSQSTVSHAIATLEEELGVVLLFRGRHGGNWRLRSSTLAVCKERLFNYLRRNHLKLPTGNISTIQNSIGHSFKANLTYDSYKKYKLTHMSILGARGI